MGIAALALTTGCLASGLTNYGGAGVYMPGSLWFDASVVPIGSGDRTGVRVTSSVPYRSLLFVPNERGFRSSMRFEVEIEDPATGRLVASPEWVDTVRVRRFLLTRRWEPVVSNRRYEVPPGSYSVRVRLTDLTDGRSRSIDPILVDVPHSSPRAGPLELEARYEGESFQPEVRTHVPGHFDSLRTRLHLWCPPEALDRSLSVRLVRYRSDSLSARPPYWVAPLLSSLKYQGIDYGRSDTLYRARKEIASCRGYRSLALKLPGLEQGVYRVQVRLAGSVSEGCRGRKNPCVADRVLSIKPDHFPEVRSFEQLLAPLGYIAEKEEVARIRETEGPTARRRAYDGFWGRISRNRSDAQHLMEVYYTRVEEANVKYTGHKAGWKTDRGMIYILLGPPARVERNLNRITWHYTGRFRLRFDFRRGTWYDNRGPLYENYILVRAPFYREVWDRVVSFWRNGIIP